MDSRTLGEYLVFFAKFDRILIDLNFIKKKKNSRKLGNGLHAVQADWDSFRKNLPDDFFNQIKENKKFSEILKNGGPKTLARRKKEHPYFCDEHSITDKKYLILACKNIRNNLVHGGKLQTNPEAVDRNHELLRCAESILIEAISYCPRIPEDKREEIQLYLNSSDL